MANRISGRVWEIDTVGVLIAAGPPVSIESIHWVDGPLNGGCIIEDGGCNVFWRSSASVAHWVDRDWLERNPLVVSTGIKVRQMTGASRLYLVVTA